MRQVNLPLVPNSSIDLGNCFLFQGIGSGGLKKADVNGENELPLYTYLKSVKGFEGFPDGQHKEMMEQMMAKVDPDWAKKPDIKWNFTKFIIDRDGNVVARFEPMADMNEVEECIKSLL